MAGFLDKHILQDPNLMNQSLMRLLQIIKMIYQVGLVFRRAHLHAPFRSLASTTPRRELLPSWWRSPTKSSAAARGSSRRTEAWPSGTRWGSSQSTTKCNVLLQERKVIEHKLTQCIELNTQYREAYTKIKNKRVSINQRPRWKWFIMYAQVVQKAKEFSFSEKYIFGRFDSFCTRLKNLLKMFTTINQFTSLFNSRTEVACPLGSVAQDFMLYLDRHS